MFPRSLPSRAMALPSGKPRSRSPTALLIGNEGAGLSETLIAAAEHRITIPMPGNVESLNAAIAGSLLLYEISVQRNAKRDEPFR